MCYTLCRVGGNFCTKIYNMVSQENVVILFQKDSRTITRVALVRRILDTDIYLIVLKYMFPI